MSEPVALPAHLYDDIFKRVLAVANGEVTVSAATNAIADMVEDHISDQWA